MLHPLLIPKSLRITRNSTVSTEIQYFRFRDSMCMGRQEVVFWEAPNERRVISSGGWTEWSPTCSIVILVIKIIMFNHSITTDQKQPLPTPRLTMNIDTDRIG